MRCLPWRRGQTTEEELMVRPTPEVSFTSYDSGQLLKLLIALSANTSAGLIYSPVTRSNARGKNFLRLEEVTFTGKCLGNQP
jgi:hypothetical protein